MSDFDEYRFRIDAYSPQSMPMARLAEYMLELAKLLGSVDRVHFAGIDAGSLVLKTNVEREASPKVFERVREVPRTVAPREAHASFTKIDKMLREDNAVAVLDRRAFDRAESATVIKFPGREKALPEKMGPFTQPATVEGELIRVGGKDETAHALLRDAEGRLWSGDVPRDIAQQLGAYLYQWISASGDARWERGEDGEWQNLAFRIKEFRPLRDERLADAVARLRSIGGSEWGHEAPSDTIKKLRHEDNEIL